MERRIHPERRSSFRRAVDQLQLDPIRNLGESANKLYDEMRFLGIKNQHLDEIFDEIFEALAKLESKAVVHLQQP